MEMWGLVKHFTLTSPAGTGNLRGMHTSSSAPLDQFPVTQKSLFSASQFLANGHSLGWMKTAQDEKWRRWSGLGPTVTALIQDVVADPGQGEHADEQQAAEQQHVVVAHRRSNCRSGLGLASRSFERNESIRLGLALTDLDKQLAKDVLLELQVLLHIKRLPRLRIERLFEPMNDFGVQATPKVFRRSLDKGLQRLWEANLHLRVIAGHTPILDHGGANKFAQPLAMLDHGGLQ